MRISFKRVLHIFLCVSALMAILTVGANAYSYPAMPSNTDMVTVTVGDVTMPLGEYVDGDYWSPNKTNMTVAEQSKYGIVRSSDIYLRGSECVGFGRYVYTALFYKYPQNATIDNALGYSYGSSYAYVNMIEKVLGTKTLSPGYSASTLKTLFTSCQPGAIMRISGHTMVLMAIYNDGCLIYDANFSSSNEVDVRAYTWQSFVDKLGSRGIEALHMPSYYPGYSYGIDTTGSTVQLDKSTAGTYVVYNCNNVNVRAGPASYTSKITTLPAGTSVDVEGTYGSWACVLMDGVRRWIHTDYLRGDVEITFDGNGGTVSHTTLAGATDSGETLTYAYTSSQTFGNMPTATKTDRTFLGWYNGDTLYTSDSKIPGANLTLKAAWCVLRYRDVLEDAWYKDYVLEAHSIGLISEDNHFSPERATSRAEFVTVLGREYQRATGTTVAPTANVFTDLKAGEYYVNYVNWAYEAGIVKGMSATTFVPDASVTREQVATFLYRYAMATGQVAEDAVQDHTLLSKFNDGSKVSDYAKDPMAWCVSVGILTGDDLGNLNPQGSCRRCEMVTMVVRFIDMMDSATAVIDIDAEEEIEAETETLPDAEDAESAEDAAAAPEAEEPPAVSAEPEETPAPSEEPETESAAPEVPTEETPAPSQSAEESSSLT